MPRRRRQNSLPSFQERSIQGGGGSLGSDIQALNSATANEIFAREQLDAERRSKSNAISLAQQEDDFYRRQEDNAREDDERAAWEAGRDGFIERISSLNPTDPDYTEKYTSFVSEAPAGAWDDPAAKILLTENARNRSQYLRDEDTRRIAGDRIISALAGNSSLNPIQQAKILNMSADGVSHDEQRAAISKMGINNATDTIENMFNNGDISMDEGVRLTQEVDGYHDITEAQRFDVIQRITTRPARIEAAKGDQVKLIREGYNDHLAALKLEKKSLDTIVSNLSASAIAKSSSPQEKADAHSGSVAAAKEVMRVNDKISNLQLQRDKAINLVRNPPKPKKTDTEPEIELTPKKQGIASDLFNK